MPSGCDILRSLTKNEQEPVNAIIGGSIPRWLSGTLYRNGPGRYEYGDKSYAHLFDGHACVQKFKIDDGQVIYSNKFLSTESYKRTLAEQRLYAVFGTADVCSDIFGRFKTFFKFPETFDNVNVNVAPFGTDQLYALTETNYLCQIDPQSLDILDRIDVVESLKTATTLFAHPHVENDGSWISMGMNVKSPRACYEFFRFRADAGQTKNICHQAEVIASVPSSHLLGLSYFHSFGLTDNFIVFLEQSLIFDFMSFVSGVLFNKAYSECLTMNKHFTTKIHLIDRRTGKLYPQKFYTQPLFVFHHINAYEVYNAHSELVQVNVDIVSYDVDEFDLNKFTYQDMFTERTIGKSFMKSLAQRIKIPITDVKSDPVRCDVFNLNSDIVVELPTINYTRFNGKPYKYMYGVNYFKRPFSVVKLNVDDPRDSKERNFIGDVENLLPSEPVFVERPDGVDEDDGLLLVLVLSNKRDYLCILDARDLSQLATAHVPDGVKTSFTFHGFFADKQKFLKLN